MKECFITVKEHTDYNENNKPGKVTKIILSKIVWVLREKRSIIIKKHLELNDRIYSLNMKDCFITVKDHKDNYKNRKLGKVSKVILKTFLKVVREYVVSSSEKHLELYDRIYPLNMTDYNSKRP